MKTAKEVCEDIEGIKNRRLINEINGIIYDVIWSGGTFSSLGQVSRFLIEKHKETLEKLGYKVEQKIYTELISTGWWLFKKTVKLKETYYVVSECCSEEKA